MYFKKQEDSKVIPEILKFIQQDLCKKYNEILKTKEKPVEKEEEVFLKKRPDIVEKEEPKKKGILDRIKPRQKVKTEMIEKKEEKKEETEEGEKKKKDPSKVRCRHWPVCKDKDCPYVHPSEQCTFFPNCRFGDKCIKIHPSVSILLNYYYFSKIIKILSLQLLTIRYLVTTD
jgi:hypothetical protein